MTLWPQSSSGTTSCSGAYGPGLLSTPIRRHWLLMWWPTHTIVQSPCPTVWSLWGRPLLTASRSCLVSRHLPQALGLGGGAFSQLDFVGQMLSWTVMPVRVLGHPLAGPQRYALCRAPWLVLLLRLVRPHIKWRRILRGLLSPEIRCLRLGGVLLPLGTLQAVLLLQPHQCLRRHVLLTLTDCTSSVSLHGATCESGC